MLPALLIFIQESFQLGGTPIYVNFVNFTAAFDRTSHFVASLGFVEKAFGREESLCKQYVLE